MRKLVLSVIALSLATASPALAQRVDQIPGAGSMMDSLRAQSTQAEPIGETIVAVVNEAVITSYDLKSRMKLAILSANLPDTLEVQQRLLPQVVRSLIDEQLQLQEGKKADITISSADIDKAMNLIANDNKIPGGDMAAFLRSQGVPPTTLRNQIKATLTWNRVITRKVRPQIDIGDDEIDAAVQRMRANAGKQEFLISEIFLAVDKAEEETQVSALADKLLEQIKGGVSFGAAARQFSQGLGAAHGGDIGWIQIGQLAPEIDKVLPNAKSGEVVGPIRTASGYHLLGIRDRRTIALGSVKEMSVKLQQLFRPFTPTTAKEVLLREAADIRQNIADCASLRTRAAQDYPQWHWQDLGDVKLDKAPQWLADKVSTIEEGRASEAMATDKGALLLFVCGRSVPDNVNRDALRTSIGTEKMELMARRLLRDLRKSAVIDVRLKGPPS